MISRRSNDPVSLQQRLLRALSVGLALLTLLVIAGTLALNSADCGLEPNLFSRYLTIASALAFMAVGLLITFYRPENRIGWILGVAGLGITSFPDVYVACNLSGAVALPAVTYVAWFAHRLNNALVVIPIFVLLPYLFPTGRFLNSRWKRLCLAGLALYAALVLVTMFAPDMRLDNGMGGRYPLDSPLQWHGLSPAVYQSLFRVQTLLIIFLSLSGVAGMIARLRRSEGIERLQMKWFVTFLATTVTIQLLLFELPAQFIGDLLDETAPEFALINAAYLLILYVVFVGLPLMIGLTIFRYRLYDIDIIIRRTLVYSLITVLLAAVYFSSVALLQALFTRVSGQASPLAIVLSTLVIAALFNPLRGRVQALIDRRFYRRKYNAQQALNSLALATRDETDMETLSSEICALIDETLQPEQVGLWISEQ